MLAYMFTNISCPFEHAHLRLGPIIAHDQSARACKLICKIPLEIAIDARSINCLNQTVPKMVFLAKVWFKITDVWQIRWKPYRVLSYISVNYPCAILERCGFPRKWRHGNSRKPRNIYSDWPNHDRSANHDLSYMWSSNLCIGMRALYCFAGSRFRPCCGFIARETRFLTGIWALKTCFWVVIAAWFWGKKRVYVFYARAVANPASSVHSSNHWGGGKKTRICHSLTQGSPPDPQIFVVSEASLQGSGVHCQPQSVLELKAILDYLQVFLQFGQGKVA